MTRLKNWFASLSDQWRATLRTAWQSLLGGFLAIVLVLINSAIGWVNGEEVDLLADLSSAGKALMLLLLTAMTSIVTFWMNRGSRGATYAPPAPPAPPA